MTILSFSILQDLNTSRMLFLDTSDYSSTPVGPTLHVKFPDFAKEFSTPIQYGEINILNTKRLGYTECLGEFPDGVYCLRFENGNGACELKDTIYRTTKAWSDFDAVLRDTDWNNNKDLLEKFNKIQLYLRGAESVVKVNAVQAQQLYRQAIDLLKCFTPNVRMYERNCACK